MLVVSTMKAPDHDGRLALGYIVALPQMCVLVQKNQGRTSRLGHVFRGIVNFWALPAQFQSSDLSRYGAVRYRVIVEHTVTM